MAQINNQGQNGYMQRFANMSIDGEYKRAPGSTFDQDNLNTFNKRQDRYRRAYASVRGPEALKDVNRYENVDDIPQYSQQEYSQVKDDYVARRGAAARQKYNVPDNPAYGEGPMNKRLTQEFKDGYAGLISKYKQGNVNNSDISNFRNIQVAEDIPDSSENVARNAQNAGATQTQNNGAQVFQEERADAQSSNPDTAVNTQTTSNTVNNSNSNSTVNNSKSDSTTNTQMASDTANKPNRGNTNTGYQGEKSRKKRKNAKERAQARIQRRKMRQSKRGQGRMKNNRKKNANQQQMSGSADTAVVNKDRSPN